MSLPESEINETKWNFGLDLEFLCWYLPIHSISGVVESEFCRSLF